MKEATSTATLFVKLGLVSALLLGASSRSLAQTRIGEGDKEVVLRKALAIPPVNRSDGIPIPMDAIEARIVQGTWSAPKAGDTVTRADGKVQTWEEIEADGAGRFATEQQVRPDAEGPFRRYPPLRYGYLFMTVESEARRPMLLAAQGHAAVYVNGVPRCGNPYKRDYVRLPVLLNRGTNGFLFQCAWRGGGLSAKLTTPEQPMALGGDPTLPDLIVGEKTNTWGALLLTNATEEALTDLSIESELTLGAASSGAASGAKAGVRLPLIPPLSVRKIGFRIEGPAPERTGPCTVSLRLVRGAGENETLAETSVPLRVSEARENHKRTFVSKIDGSVQYYALNPARSLDPGKAQAPALFLSVHGADVEATNQANSYGPKTWGHVVAPTNRRPYGFSWEDWGRMDAMEVLDIASDLLKPDPRRIYLSGHSMGGHGSWYLGSTYPGRFAAIGPCSGRGAPSMRIRWEGEEKYEEVDEKALTPMEKMLRRAASPSNITERLTRNLKGLGVYIIHGEADEIVPVQESRKMVEHLKGFHEDFHYHEQPGAGHWWESLDEPGAECQDWPAMYDFFARHTIPSNESTRHVEFSTANPGISAWRQWACIEAQIHPLEPSSVYLRYDPWKLRFAGTTDNVARLALDLAHATKAEPLQVEIDGQSLANVPFPAEKRIWLARESGSWAVAPKPSPDLKGPRRYGPLKEAFQNRFTLVYGTQGTPEENAWAFNKARYDAEEFWRGANGAPEIVADKDFDPAAEPGRAAILYGNADTNGAWKALLGKSPVQVKRGEVRVGDRTFKGDDLACLCVRPRPGSDAACVAFVSGSGMLGMRLTDRLPSLTGGPAFPDCVVLDPTSLSKGAEGVRAAGFFGLDWGLESGEFVWKE